MLEGTGTGPASGPELLTASLPASTKSAYDARHSVQEVLAGRIDPDVLDTVLLLATELVSNAVACAGTPLDLRVVCSPDGVLRVEVADRSPSPARPVEGYHPESESGRGLRLVDALADSWGTAPDASDGKGVWFALRT